MAKKKVHWEDMFNESTAPSWAVQERQNFLNKDKEYNAIIDAYAKDMGVEFDAEARKDMLLTLHSGKKLDFGMAPEEEAAPVVPKRAERMPGVEGGSVSSEEGTWGDTLGTIGATVRDSLKNAGARLLEQSERLPSVGSTYSLIDQLTGVDPAEVPRQTIDSIRKSANDPLRVAQSAQLSERFNTEGGVGGFVGGGVMDAAQSPSSVLSLVGGPVGAVAVADAYAAAYEQGQKEGLKDEQLEAWALSQAAPELVSVIPAGKVVTSLPVIGPLIKKRLAAAATGALEKKIANPILAGGVRTAKAMAGESLEEVATGSVQDLAAAAFAGQTQAEDLQRMGQKAMPQDEEGNFSIAEFLSNRGRDARAAIVTAGAAGPLNQYGSYKDYKKQRAEQNDRTVADILANDAAKGDKLREDNKMFGDELLRTARERDRVPEQGSLLDPATEDAPSFEEQDAARRKQIEEDAAWKIREQQKADEAKRAERPDNVEGLRDSIVRRMDTATDKVEQLRELVESGDTSSATLSSLAAAKREENRARVTLERFDKDFAQKPEAETASTTKPVAKEPQQQELPLPANPALTEASTLLETAKKKQQEIADKKKATEKGQETQRRNKLAQQVAEQHKDKTPEEQAQILSDLINDPNALPTSTTKEQTPEEKVQGVINQVEGLRKRKATSRVNNRIRSLYRQDPTRTAKDIADILAREEGATTATDEEADAPTEAELAEKVSALKNKAELNVDEAVEAVGVHEQQATKMLDTLSSPPKRTPEQQKAFEKKVREIVSAMPNTQENVDIRNLIRQGKLIVTDKAESIGRKTTRAGASYVPGEGKMYMYLDKLAGQNPKAAMLAAFASHEAGHAGQFNQREGRSALFKYLLGDKGNAEANNLIRSLAKSGNKLARSAVVKAQEAAKNNKTTDNVENLELVPYLFSEAKLNSPGRLGKIVRDLKVGARQAGRKIGLKSDFSLDEIIAAADQMAGEIVKTDLTPEGELGPQVEMIGGRYAKGFKEAESEGRVFTPAVDNQNRFEFDDSEAEVVDFADSDVPDRLQQGRTVPLSDLLIHPELESQYPELYKDLVVRVDPKMDPSTTASFLGNRITLSPSALLDGALDPEGLRNTLLHETQHAIQAYEGFVAGANKSSFIPQSTKQLVEHDAKRLDQMVSDFELGAAVKGLSEEARRRWESSNPNKMSRPQQVLTFVQGGFHNYTDDRAAQRLGNRITAAQTNLKNSRAELALAERKAFNTYLKDRGEAEARAVEARSRMTPAEREANKFEDQVGRDVGLTADQLINTDKLKGQPAASAVLNADADTETAAANPKYSIKERINRILSHGRQDRLDTVKIAEDLHSQFVDAVKMDTGSPVMTAEMNNEMMEFLSSPEQGTVEGRARIIEEMSAKYPATTKVLVEARDRISDMTMDRINDMLSTGRPLSVTERKQIATMLANKDTYMSRAYAAFQADRGRKWANTRWKNFAKNIGKDVEAITNPKVRADVIAVRDAITVITKGLTIPDENTLQDMTMEQLVGMADRHGIKESQLQFDRTDPDAQWLKRDELIGELLKVKQSYPEGKLEEIAMMDAKDLLGLGDRGSAFVKQMSALARNPGTLKERQRVPLEIRRLLGEIELAPGAFMATMANQAALRARAKVVSELINDPEGNIALTREKWLNLPEKERNKYKEVRSEEWGGLNGMYLRDYAYDRMEEVTGLMYSWRDAAKRMSHDVSPILGKTIKGVAGTLGALNRYNKLATVVYNPFSWIGNFGGSFLNMVGAGNFSPAAMTEGMGTAREYVGGTFKTTTTPRLSKVIRYMNLEAADIAELQKVLGNTLEKYFDNPTQMQDAVAKLDKHGHTLAGRVHKSVIAGYAIADNWSKIANFYHRYGVLKNMYEAAGIKKTEEQILQEAGDDTSYTNISPERVHAVIRAAESAGVSQYAPYFAEVLRTRVTNVLLSYKDFKRANQLRAEGLNKAANIMYTTAAARLSGQIVVNALLPAVGAFKIGARLTAVGVPAAAAYTLANTMSALGGDEEDNEKKRRMISEANRIQDMILVGHNADGYPIYMPFSQKLDPNGPFTDLMRAYAYAETPEELYKNLWQYGITNLLIFPQIVKDTASLVTKDNYPESDIGRLLPGLKQEVAETVGANNADGVLNVLDNLIPGVFRAYKTQNTVDGVKTDPVTKRNLEWMNAAGIRFETLDPRRTLKGYADVSNEQKAKNNGALNRDLLNVPTPTRTSVLNATEKFFREELNRQKEDYKNVQSLRAWKFNDEQIGELLSQGGFPKKSIPDMVEGNAVVALKLKSLYQYAESSGSYQDSRDYAKRKEKTVQLINLIAEMEPELNEMGIVVDSSEMPKGWNE